jgi:hypothetical protein
MKIACPKREYSNHIPKDSHFCFFHKIMFLASQRYLFIYLFYFYFFNFSFNFFLKIWNFLIAVDTIISVEQFAMVIYSCKLQQLYILSLD